MRVIMKSRHIVLKKLSITYCILSPRPWQFWQLVWEKRSKRFNRVLLHKLKIWVDRVAGINVDSAVMVIYEKVMVQKAKTSGFSYLQFSKQYYWLQLYKVASILHLLILYLINITRESSKMLIDWEEKVVLWLQSIVSLKCVQQLKNFWCFWSKKKVDKFVEV